MAGRVTLLAVVLLLPGCASSPAVSDAAVAYCAAPGKRQETLDAAVALKLIDSRSAGNKAETEGKSLSFDEWRDQRGPDFNKACSALAEPQMRPPQASSPPGWVTIVVTALTSAFSALVGAGITWVVGNKREDRTRRKQQAVVLRTASSEFVAAVREYCDAKLKDSADGGPPSALELWRKRDALITQFSVTAMLWPRWTAPLALRAEAAAFDGDVERGWGHERNRSELRRRADELVAAAVKLDSRVEVLARGLERPAGAKRLFVSEFGQVVRV
jgi:hypothetical protein